MSDLNYHCYLIHSDASNTTYIGITTDVDRRLKQHNQILKGGAKYTKRSNDWKYVSILSNLDRSNASKLEIEWKKSSGLNNRISQIESLCSKYNCVNSNNL